MGEERAQKLRQALGNDQIVEGLRRQSPTLPNNEDRNVEVVVFVLHGIRDMGAWTSQFEGPLQEAFQKQFPQSQAKLYIDRASYDYLGMGPFLLWADRQAHVRWFMDEYTELKARFPSLKQVHFIGHSNGTYILASALQKYKTLKVDRVVFAGQRREKGLSMEPPPARTGRAGTELCRFRRLGGWDFSASLRNTTLQPPQSRHR